MSSKPDPKLLAWTDIETTGLDINLDYIIEYGMIITDFDLNERAVYKVIVQPTNTTQACQRIIDNPFVLDMHTKNGLFQLISDGLGLPLRLVEKEVCTLLGQHGEPQDYLIAGSGVAQFDQPWIRQHVPSIDKFFQYSPFDISNMRRFIKFVLNRPDLLPEGKEQHRVIPDLDDAIEQCRTFRDTFGNALKALEALGKM